jgi:hypothetical protein
MGTYWREVINKLGCHEVGLLKSVKATNFLLIGKLWTRINLHFSLQRPRAGVYGLSTLEIKMKKVLIHIEYRICVQKAILLKLSFHQNP